MVQPTVGRKVWYFPQGNNNGEQPHDATIVAVYSDTSVTLACHDQFGAGYAVQGAFLMPSDFVKEPGNVYPAHAEWMPFQVTQAQK